MSKTCLTILAVSLIGLFSSSSARACGDLLTDGRSMISVSVGDGEGVAKGTGKYWPGKTVTVTATPAKGYRFSHWHICNGDRIVTGSTYTYTVPKCSTEITAFFVADVKNKVVSVIDSGKGTVTGAGTYRSGDKVKLTATPASGYVFQCWDFDSLPQTFNERKWRQTAISFAMPEDRVEAHAYFVKKSADTCRLFIDGDEANRTWYPSGTGDEISIVTESLSYAKVSVSTLPTGLKLAGDPSSDNDFVLRVTDFAKMKTGGVKTVKVTAKNRAGKTVTRSIRVMMPNRTTAVDKGLLELDTDPSSGYRLQVGQKVVWSDLDIYPAPGWTLTVGGLPSGLKWDAEKRKVTGTPTKSGTYCVKFTVRKGTSSYSATATFIVRALPASVCGTFRGYTTYDWELAPDHYSKNVKVTVASSGKITAKVGSATYSASGFSKIDGTSYSAVLTRSEGTMKSTPCGSCPVRSSLAFTINASAPWNSLQLVGTYAPKQLTNCGCDMMARPYDVIAQRVPFGKNSAGAYVNTAAGAVVKRLNKAGTLKLYKDGYSSGCYTIAGPGCMPSPLPSSSLAVKVSSSGVVTLSGKIGSLAVNAQSVLKVGPSSPYEMLEDGDLVPYVDFVFSASSKAVRMHLEFSTTSLLCRHGWATVGSHDISEVRGGSLD